MAGEHRTAADAVAFFAELEREPWAHELYATLRRIECLHPGSPGLGRSMRPAEDPVRLSAPPSMAFAPSTIESFTFGKDGRPGTLATRYLGLFGPNGALPLHLTEFARDRLRNSGDPTFARFADLFQHRMLSLFYRAWADAQPVVNLDRDERDRFAVYVGALLGLGTDGVRNRDAFPDSAKCYFAGRLSAGARTAEGLRDMLAGDFEVPVRILEFFGEWLELRRADRVRLGETPRTGTLGINMAVGARVWGVQHKFRIVIGPVGFAAFRRLLPGTKHLARLVSLVRLYAGDEMAWDINLILAGDEVPELALGRSGTLGQTSWLGGSETDRDRADAVIAPMSMPGAYSAPIDRVAMG